MDKLTKEQRHRCMSAIKGKNTKPELLVRKFLFSRGFRYRLNHPRLPGHPDIVLRKYRTVIFVNTRVRDKDCVKNRVKRAKIVRFTLC